MLAAVWEEAMKPVFVNTIIFVKDIERAKAFYAGVLGQTMTQDFGAIVFFENHLVLHQADAIAKTVFKRESEKARRDQGGNNLLVYFESDELEDIYRRVCDAGASVIHAIEKQAWGQRVFRFFDPDGHILEIGEPLHAGGQ